jgi:uncharacterized short protein YbdD (DUF466 family)
MKTQKPEVKKLTKEEFFQWINKLNGHEVSPEFAERQWKRYESGKNPIKVY